MRNDVNRLVSIKVEARLTVHCQQFGNGSSCGKQITITANESTAIATCVGSVHFLHSFGIIIWINCAQCPGCSNSQLDFSKGLFEFFTGGNLDVALIGSWSFLDVSGGGNNSDISKSSGASTDLASQTANPIQKTPIITSQGPPSHENDSVISRSSGASADRASQTANPVQETSR
jgi:hypothetical protein